MAGRPPNPVDQSTYSGRFAARLRTRMARRKITAPELAAAVGITPDAVHRWLRGSRVPEYDSLPRIAAALGCRPGDLFPPA